nr:unnamed protein product [Callosobruchus analis]
MYRDQGDASWLLSSICQKALSRWVFVLKYIWHFMYLSTFSQLYRVFSMFMNGVFRIKQLLGQNSKNRIKVIHRFIRNVKLVASCYMVTDDRHDTYSYSSQS